MLTHQNLPRYNEQPDGQFTYIIEKQPFNVNVFFNQNSQENLQDKLLRVILTDQQRGGDSRV